MKCSPTTPLLALALLVSPACISNGTGTAGLLVGRRDLSTADWAPVEEQLSVQVESSYVSADNGWGLEASAGRSTDEVSTPVKIESIVDELSLGVRKEFALGDGARLKPYLGLGAAGLQAEATVGPSSVDDTTLGAYAHGGLRLDVTEDFYIGFDVRGMFGTSVTFNGVEGDVDYVQYGLTIGVNY